MSTHTPFPEDPNAESAIERIRKARCAFTPVDAADVARLRDADVELSPADLWREHLGLGYEDPK